MNPRDLRASLGEIAVGVAYVGVLAALYGARAFLRWASETIDEALEH